MTKNHKDPNVQKVMQLAENNEVTSIEWMNSRGDQMTLRAIPPFLVQMATESVDSPEIPTYVITTAGGEEEVHKHDAESIEQSGPEDKKKWAEYEISLKVANEHATEVLLNIILLEGVVLTFSDPKRLEKRMKMLGIQLPEDPDEKEFALKKAYAISSGKDAKFIMDTVMNLTGIRREDIESLKQSFPGEVESGT